MSYDRRFPNTTHTHLWYAQYREQGRSPRSIIDGYIRMGYTSEGAENRVIENEMRYQFERIAKIEKREWWRISKEKEKLIQCDGCGVKRVAGTQDWYLRGEAAPGWSGGQCADGTREDWCERCTMQHWLEGGTP